MPYNAFTNDSDTQFAQQLDDYKLGTSRSGGTDYEEAIGAFDALPESLAVGEIMKMRAMANDRSIETRKSVALDKTMQRNADEFDAFNDEYQKMGIASDDYEGQSKALFELQSKSPANPLIKDAVSALSGASENILKGRAAKSASRQMDMEDANRTMLEDTARLGIKNAFIQGKSLNEKLRVLEEDDETNVSDNFSNMLGGLHERFPDLAEKGAVWGERYGKDPEMAREVRAMGKMVAGLGRASYLEDANAYPIRKIESTIHSLKGKGVDLNFDLPPEQIAAAYEKAKNLYEPGSKEDNEVESSIKIHSSLYDTKLKRKALQDNIGVILDRKDDLSTPEAKQAFKEEMAGIRMKMGALVGQVDKDYNDRENQEKVEDRNRELNKERLNILKVTAGMENDKQSVILRKMALQFKKTQGNKDQFFDLLRQIDPKHPVLKKIKTTEDMKAFMDDAGEQFDFEDDSEGIPGW